MSFSIADLFRVCLLLLNAMAILSERRLLEPYGLGGGGASSQSANGLDGPVASSGGKEGLGQILKSVRTLLRGPLVILNVITIAFSLVFG